MPRKRYKGPEATLTSVIRLLERDAPAETRVALGLLFLDGPLLASDFGIERASDEDLEAVRDALRAQLRWLVTKPNTPLWWDTSTTPTFGLVMHERRPEIGLQRPATFSREALQDAARLSFMLAIRETGLANVAACAASDCHHMFIRFHKRTYCSPTCQKRAYMRQRRENERRARARRRQRLRLVREQKRRA